MNKIVFTDHKVNTTATGLVEVYIRNKKITVTVGEYLQYICSDVDWSDYDNYTDRYLHNLILNRKVENLLKS